MRAWTRPGWLDERDPLFASYRPLVDAAPGRPFVIAQLGQSLDGRIATPSGSSHFINGPAALDHLHRLRALVDAVVVGVNTVIADDSRLTVRRVEGRNPARVVIDPHGRLRPGARMLAADGAMRLRLTGGPAPALPGCETIALPAPDGRIAAGAIVAALLARGLSRILVEGGARTVSGFITEDRLDRLHMLVSPVLIGSGQPGLVLPAIDRVADAPRPRTEVHVLADGDVLFDCDLRSRRPYPGD